MDDRISVSTDFEPVLLGCQEAPLVSLYLRTHRTSPDNQQDRVRFKNLATKARDLLAKESDSKASHAISSYLKEIEDDLDRSIWRVAQEGLAVLVNKDGALVYFLDYLVDDEVTVSDSFHIKPLVRNFQYGSRYYLLALSMDSFALYKGDFHSLDEVELPEDIDTHFRDLFDDYNDGFLMSGGYPGGRTVSLFGRESKSEMTEKDTEKFFRYVDKAIKCLFTDLRSYPLILVSLTQNQSVYRSISNIPCLLSEGIDKPFDALGKEAAREAAVSVICSLQESTINELVEKYAFEESRELASTDPSTIANALLEKKVTALFLEGDHAIRGSYDSSTGALSFADANDQNAHDIGDDFLRETYLQGGKAYVLSAERMPSKTGVAAYFRY